MADLTRPIFLLTDFGTRDAYAGQVKAVIAGIAPHSPIIDLTHDVEPFAIDEGSWLLETSMSALPPDAVVVAVVDPGVDTARRGLLVLCEGRAFIGPDNGLLSCAFPPELRDGRGGASLDVRELTDPRFHRATVSATFHARDIFGPVAAHIAAGLDHRLVGPPAATPVLLPPCCGQLPALGELRGEVVHIDRFGNLITTIRAAQLFPAFELQIAGRVIARQVRTFADAPPGEPFCHADSSGYIAIAVNQGSAVATLRVARRDPVVVRAR